MKLLTILLSATLLLGCTGKKGDEKLPPPKAQASEQSETMETKPPATCDDQLYKGDNPQLPSPMTKDSQELCFNGFVVLYSAVTKTPLYSAEQLTRERLRMSAKLDRIDNFHEESRIKEKVRALLSDYTKSGYDRGHLAPNADMYDRKSQYDSFSLANIAPQAPKLNRGSWSALESNVRQQVKKVGIAYVVTGTLYKGQTAKSLNGVIVPSHFYKAVYYPTVRNGAVYVAVNSNSGNIEKMTFAQFKRWTDIDVMPELTKD